MKVHLLSPHIIRTYESVSFVKRTKDKDNKGSTENGRDKIISNSIYLEDKILWGLSERETGRGAPT